MILLDQDRTQRTLVRMAFQIIEKAAGDPLCLVGINERGYAVASVLKRIIAENREEPVHLVSLNADDDSQKPISPPVNGRAILVMVDDVIFSGRTMYRAIQKVQNLNQFRKTIVATLADRGHRTLPIYAEIVGLDVPTKLNEHVECVLHQQNPHQVILTRNTN
ncbi:MAG: phosphoribosyltransferase family protein [Balneolaceae bacterium]